MTTEANTENKVGFKTTIKGAGRVDVTKAGYLFMTVDTEDKLYQIMIRLDQPLDKHSLRFREAFVSESMIEIMKE